MQITDLQIRNFKSIKSIHISDIENALILVGQNNTGKTAVLDAIRAVSGDYQICLEDFLEDFPNIEIEVKLQITEEDLTRMQEKRIISPYRIILPGIRIFAGSFLPIRTGSLPLSLQQTKKDGSATVTAIRKTTAISRRSFQRCIISEPRERWIFSRKTSCCFRRMSF